MSKLGEITPGNRRLIAVALVSFVSGIVYRTLSEHGVDPRISGFCTVASATVVALFTPNRLTAIAKSFIALVIFGVAGFFCGAVVR